MQAARGQQHLLFSNLTRLSLMRLGPLLAAAIPPRSLAASPTASAPPAPAARRLKRAAALTLMLRATVAVPPVRVLGRRCGIGMVARIPVALCPLLHRHISQR